jgi:hypothetical protein
MRHFPPPLSIEGRRESFIVKDATRQQLTDLYFESRQMSMKQRILHRGMIRTDKSSNKPNRQDAVACLA